MYDKSCFLALQLKALKNDPELFLILRVVRQFPGITAKKIGQKVRLSTYISLLYAINLVKLQLLTYKEVVFGEEQGSKAYLFYPLTQRDAYKIACNNQSSFLQERLSGYTSHLSRTCSSLFKSKKPELCNMSLANHADLSDASNHEITAKTDRIRDLSVKFTLQVRERLKDTGVHQLLQSTDKPIYNQQVVDLLTQKLTKLTAVCEQQGIQVRSIESRLNDQERRTEMLEAKLDALCLSNTSNYYTIRGYCNINRIKISQKEAQSLGTEASKICRQKGYSVRKMSDERYGEVNTYPIEVLEEVIELYKKKKIG